MQTPRDIKALGWQDPPQAMPEHCEKIGLMKYTNRETPLWITNKIDTTVST
jgi:hypothetical protein